MWTHQVGMPSRLAAAALLLALASICAHGSSQAEGRKASPGTADLKSEASAATAALREALQNFDDGEESMAEMVKDLRPGREADKKATEGDAGEKPGQEKAEEGSSGPDERGQQQWLDDLRSGSRPNLVRTEQTREGSPSPNADADGSDSLANARRVVEVGAGGVEPRARASSRPASATRATAGMLERETAKVQEELGDRLLRKPKSSSSSASSAKSAAGTAGGVAAAGSTSSSPRRRSAALAQDPEKLLTLYEGWNTKKRPIQPLKAPDGTFIPLNEDKLLCGKYGPLQKAYIEGHIRVIELASDGGEKELWPNKKPWCTVTMENYKHQTYLLHKEKSIKCNDKVEVSSEVCSSGFAKKDFFFASPSPDEAQKLDGKGEDCFYWFYVSYSCCDDCT